jgi:calcium-dependent protein kinase
VQLTERYSDIAGTAYYIAPEILQPNFSGHDIIASDMWSLGVMVFIMITGGPPFYGDDDTAIMETVKTGVYEWPEDTTPSLELKDFVAKLLTKNVAARLTAAQALDHPWLAALENNSDALLAHARTALTVFNNQNKVKKAVAAMISKNMTPDASKQLCALFASLDQDGDGKLDLGEITAYMKKLYGDADGKAVDLARRFLTECDTDGDGWIDLDEFKQNHVQGTFFIFIYTNFVYNWVVYVYFF